MTDAFFCLCCRQGCRRSRRLKRKNHGVGVFASNEYNNVSEKNGMIRIAQYNKYIATGVVLLFAAGVLYLVRIFFVALFGAYIFSFLFSPVYLGLNRRIRNDHISALLTLTLIALVALMPMLLVTYTAFQQAVAFQDRLNLEEINRLMQGIHLPVSLQKIVQRLVMDLSNSIADSLPTIFSTASHVAISVFIMFIVMYSIFLKIHYVIARSLEYLPFSQKNAIWLIKQFEQISRAVLIGQLMISGLQGLLGGLGFYFLGIPNSALWGVMMAILSLVPIFGTSLIWLPAGIYFLAQGDNVSGILILLWGGIVVSHIDNVVRPIFGSKLGNINPVVMLVGAFSGLDFFGIVGVVLGPLILAFFFALLQVYRQEYLGHPVPMTRAQVLETSDSH